MVKKTVKTTKSVKTPKTVKAKKIADVVPQDIAATIQQTVVDIIGRIGIEATVTVAVDAEENYRVNVSTLESGLLIGRHGETINGLQLFLGVVLFKKLGRWVRVVLDVGDYRSQRESTIREMVNRIITEVETTKQPVSLPFLTPLERRSVHVMLTDHATVMSESVGEGRDRRLTIKPRVV
jgi:spoIIIJ-associated protein